MSAVSTYPNAAGHYRPKPAKPCDNPTRQTSPASPRLALPFQLADETRPDPLQHSVPSLPSPKLDTHRLNAPHLACLTRQIWPVQITL